MKYIHVKGILFMLALTACISMGVKQAGAASAEEIDRKVKSTLEHLYSKSPEAQALGEKFKQATFIPALISSSRIAGELQAGPIVHTILVLER